ncbi:hypothetical protein DV515_00005988 [Chloebia gouldiae]|uniref:Uncharacterized protein n=1 Tax=Chloebia gouldiae TaxID=44316 RepID=A0A3L8SKZ8_CHLGU|nr:hypothetical protein DV515_00005988 [Chloebia gouldiae]
MGVGEEVLVGQGVAEGDPGVQIPDSNLVHLSEILEKDLFLSMMNQCWSKYERPAELYLETDIRIMFPRASDGVSSECGVMMDVHTCALAEQRSAIIHEYVETTYSPVTAYARQTDRDAVSPTSIERHAQTLQKSKINENLGETTLLSQLHNDLTNKLDISTNSISSLTAKVHASGNPEEEIDYTYVIIGVTLGAVLAIGFVAVIICMMKAKMVDSDFGESDGKMERRSNTGSSQNR